jgi:SAM-dependent methyltransferase
MPQLTSGTSRVDNVEFWENLYQTNVTPWDLGQAAPPFKTFLDSPYAIPRGTIGVLGCGAGHECMLFAERGFEVVGIDFAPSAITATQQKFQSAGLLNKNAFVVQSDLFNLHHLNGRFDYILEHTCFCAIDPSKRRTYSYTVRDLLKVGGKLVALWWLLEKSGGPPFSVDESEIFNLFKDDFRFDILHRPNDSVPDRQNKELFTVFTRMK